MAGAKGVPAALMAEIARRNASNVNGTPGPQARTGLGETVPGPQGKRALAHLYVCEINPSTGLFGTQSTEQVKISVAIMVRQQWMLPPRCVPHGHA